MRALSHTFCTLDSHSIVICAPALTLEIDKHTGEWRQIVMRDEERKLVPPGGAVHGFDLQLEGRWLSAAGAPELIQWEQRTEGGQFALLLEMSLAPFQARQWIRMDPDGMGFQRFFELRYRGGSRAVLKAVELSLPAIRMEDGEGARLLLPNHLPFRTLAVEEIARRAGTRDAVDAQYAAGLPAPGGMETFPDNWNGFVAIYHEPSHAGVCTFLSPAAVPIAFCCREMAKGFAISAFQRQEMFLEPGESLVTTTQHVRFFKSAWQVALEEYQKSLASWGFEPPRDVPSWVTGAAGYETAICQWRGCSGLERALPALRSMGIDALYLLPIWSAVEVTDDMRRTMRLDPSWQGKALPYRISDFESLDPRAGSEEEIRRLISSAHSLGMRVLLDYVFHGIAEPSWLIQRRPHWLVRDENGVPRASHGWEPGFSLDWAIPEVQEYLVEFGLRQVADLDLDGLRIHAPFWKESNWSPGDGRQPFETNLAGLAIVERLRSEMRRIKPDAVLLCEARGPAFIKSCDVLHMNNVSEWLARLGREEISPGELHEYLRDVRLCYPEGTLLQYALENHDTGFWQPSPRALRGSAVARPLFAVAALAGDVVSIWHGQERGQEDFFRRLLAIRKNSEVLSQGLVLHRGIQWQGERHLAWLRHLGTALALITASFDPLRSRAVIEIAPDLLVYFSQRTVRHRRIFPHTGPPEDVDLKRLQSWAVETNPYSVVIDLFQEVTMRSDE